MTVAGQSIGRGTIPGVATRASRLVLGVLEQKTEEGAEEMLDAFFERGGNAIDTAWTYAAGAHERLVGRWLARRGVRESTVIVTKGAHTPLCFPEHVGPQLSESLARLETDYVDLYLLHRDNQDVPVGEFVGVLNDELAAGRIQTFGVSNWSRERVAAAVAYAGDAGLVPPVAVSNQLSLARMVEPPFPGGVSAHDPEFRGWLEQRRLVLLAWSSQARGFFSRADERLLERTRVARAARVALRRALGATGSTLGGWEQDEFVRCWYSRDNFRRLGRARELAQERGISPAAIALAWLLSQPFPTFALIGPATIRELEDSIQALTVRLTAHDLQWLELGQ